MQPAVMYCALQMRMSGLEAQLKDLVELVRTVINSYTAHKVMLVCRRSSVHHRMCITACGTLQIYIDAPHDASGPVPADVQPYFDPPYREW